MHPLGMGATYELGHLMNFKNFLCFVFLLVFISPAFSGAETISEIKITGNKKISNQVLISALGSDVGDEFSNDKIQKGIKNLYSIGLFSQINVSRDDTADGLVLVLDVTERLVLDSIKLSGSKKIKEKNLREKLALRIGQPFSPSKEAQSIRQMKALYQEKGYFLAQIEAIRDTLANSTVAVEMKIKEGRLLGIEPGIGRMLGAFDLAQWKRRLLIVFSDMYA